MRYLHVFYAYPSSFYASEFGGVGWYYGTGKDFNPCDDETVRGVWNAPQAALDAARADVTAPLAPGVARYLAEFGVVKLAREA